MSRKIFITEHDMQKLKKIIDNEIEFSNDKNYIQNLETELMRAKMVSNSQLPEDVITMNSKVLLFMDGVEEELMLVYPDEADVSVNKISVLSPIGTAILGYREGDEIGWNVPSGMTKIKVKKVIFQPEAADKMH